MPAGLYFPQQCSIFQPQCSILPIRENSACARGSQYFVCLSVCYQSPGFFSCLYDKSCVPTCFSLAFLLTDFDRTVSFRRYSAFHGYFVVSSPDERFRILLVAIAITSNVLHNTCPQYHFCQLSKYDQS